MRGCVHVQLVDEAVDLGEFVMHIGKIKGLRIAG